MITEVARAIPIVSFEMLRLLSDLRRLFLLPAPRRRRALVAAWRLSRVAVGLRLRGYSNFRRALERRTPTPRDELGEADRARAALDAWAVRAVAARVPWGTCLRRSPALWWMLRRQGIASDIRFGAALEGDLEAHAWLEVAGEPVTDPIDPRRDHLVLESD